jgi:hypothetical protein
LRIFNNGSRPAGDQDRQEALRRCTCLPVQDDPGIYALLPQNFKRLMVTDLARFLTNGNPSSRVQTEMNRQKYASGSFRGSNAPAEDDCILSENITLSGIARFF